MIRLPKRRVDRAQLDACLVFYSVGRIVDAGDNLILDLCFNDEPPQDHECPEGSGLLDQLAPLRVDLLSGDMRPLYIIWLSADSRFMSEEEREPLPWIGPVTDRLQALADFIYVDAFLLQAAAESAPGEPGASIPKRTIRAAVSSIPRAEKNKMLYRVAKGDPDAASEIQTRVTEEIQRRIMKAAAKRLSAWTPRTVSELSARAAVLREEWEIAEATRLEAQRLRQQRDAEKKRAQYLASLKSRSEETWREIESELERRTGRGYDRAAALVEDLRELAEKERETSAFGARLKDLLTRHDHRKRFLDRLKALSLGP